MRAFAYSMLVSVVALLISMALFWSPVFGLDYDITMSAKLVSAITWIIMTMVVIIFNAVWRKR